MSTTCSISSCNPSVVRNATAFDPEPHRTVRCSAAARRTAVRRCGSKAVAQADDRGDTVFVARCEIRSMRGRARHNHQILAVIPGPDPPYREAGPGKQMPKRGGAKI